MGAVENSDVVHAAINLGSTVNTEITVLASQGIDLALFQRLAAGTYRVVLEEGIAPNEVAFAAASGLNFDGTQIVRVVARPDPADPTLRAWLITLITTDAPIAAVDGFASIVWFKIATEYQPVTFT